MESSLLSPGASGKFLDDFSTPGDHSIVVRDHWMLHLAARLVGVVGVSIELRLGDQLPCHLRFLRCNPEVARI